MADIYSPNIAAASVHDAFGHIWQSVRASLKAGWLLKHSSDGANVASANSADPMNCKWVAPAIVQDHSADGAASIGAQTGKDFLFTGLTGLVTPSKTNRGGSEGNLLVVSNGASAGNNVTWLITQVVSASSCYARPLVPSAVTSGGTSPPTMTIYGHLARTTTFNLKVMSDTTGALGSCKVKISLDGGVNYAAAVTIPTTQTVEVIDLNGVATGIYLYFSAAVNGANDNYWTATTAVASDANNGSIHWVERSWLTSTYATGSNYAWILLEGPCTLKVPFTTAPTGTFLRGENVVQTTSNAEGEILGVTYEPSTGVGYLVISPRLQGGGTGVEGWGTGVITGAVSGATVTPSTNPIRLVRELVIWRDWSLYNLQVFYQPAFDATENPTRFGWLSVSATGVNATTAPGGGGTNNSNTDWAAGPAIPNAMALCGRAGQQSAQTNACIQTGYNVGASTIGKLQHFQANCIERQGVSADGSWFGSVGQPTTSLTSSGGIPFFMRMDGHEEGDLEPYCLFAAGRWVSWTKDVFRTGNTTQAGNGEGEFPAFVIGCRSSSWGSQNLAGWCCWARRGLTGDNYADGAPLFPVATNGSTPLAHATMSTEPERVGATARTTAPLIFQPIEIGLFQVHATRGRKGTCRWLFVGDGVNYLDTWGNKAWLQINPMINNNWAGVSVFMPWDGSSVPSQ